MRSVCPAVHERPSRPRVATAPSPARGRSIVRRRLAALVLALLPSAAAHAQALGVATWNVNWLMDADTHARWATACARHGWPADPSALPAGERGALAGLPYCDVHNGMRYPRDRCRATRDGWPDAARYPDDHPCRATADLRTWPAYARKVAALRATFARLDADGVALVALQEVSGAPAVQAILPPGWHVATTRELPGAPAIAQHVGIAWRAGTRVRDVDAVAALADGGVPERPLRPGLAFTVDVGGRPVRALVVHLKAGCRHRDLDAPLTARDATAKPERQDAIASDCAMLRYQLPALEAWIDAHADRDFAVLGDFNRALASEPLRESADYRVRLDGTSARDPLGPCTMTRDGARLVAQCAAKTRAVFPELNDGNPAGAVLWRARFADARRGGTIPRGSSGDCRIAGAHGELTHDGIDHVLIGDSFKRRLAPSALTMRVVNYASADGTPVVADAGLALPSDHCPHVVEWTPLPRR